MDEQEYLNIFDFLSSPDKYRVWPAHVTAVQKPNFRRKCKSYQLVAGTVHYLHKKHGLVRVIKAPEKDAILQACHSAPTSGHFAVNKTWIKIAER